MYQMKGSALRGAPLYTINADKEVNSFGDEKAEGRRTAQPQESVGSEAEEEQEKPKAPEIVTPCCLLWWGALELATAGAPRLPDELSKITWQGRS